jgi:hypothetical protein
MLIRCMNLSFVVGHERIYSLFVCRAYSVSTYILINICEVEYTT